MKNIRRILAVLLAAALLAGLLPAALLTASAVDPANLDPLAVTAAPRYSVMLDASGLKKADTVVFGYAQNGDKVYPLEWQVGDVKEDSTGKKGGRLLISKYLLPAAVTDTATGGIDTAASYGNISMPDGSSTVIHMPDAAAVLPAFKADTDYIADLGANLGQYNILYPTDINAGLSVRGDTASGRRALENASFFELSAEEAEKYISNSKTELKIDNATKLLRRPYAAGYAVSDAGDRSWSLRGKTLLGDAIAVSRGLSDSAFSKTEYADGLVREAGDSALLSRPAFNLRTNAISFFYTTTVTLTPSSDKFIVIPDETAPQFGGSEELTAVTEEKSGALTWRAALETLPLTSAATTYHADGTVELVFENNAIGYKIGVLTADSDGKLLSYGTARDNVGGGHVIFTPAEGVSKMYFFTYQFNDDTDQLYTSNLIEVTAQKSAAMSLGTGLLGAGDRVYFNDNEAVVLNADMGIPGMENTGSTGSLTETGTTIDDPPVLNQDAMLMMIDTGGSVSYGTTAQLIANNVPFLSSTRYYDEYAKALADAQAELNTAAEKGTAAASASKDALKAQQADYFYSAFGADVASPLSKAIAYTWLSDSAYPLSSTYSDGYFPFTADISVQEEKHSVYGKQLFFLSAGEFLALPVSTRLAVGNIILRSKVTETYGIPATSDSLTVISDPAVACEIQVATLNSFFSAKSGIRERAAFHLRKNRIVYSVQSSALDRSLTSSENLHTVGSYDCSCKTYEIAILDETVHPEFYMGMTSSYGPVTYSVGNLPSHSNSYIALLVTDAAGNVKQYGRISENFDFTLDLSDYDYGDRVYGIYEYEIANADHPTVYASEPQLIYTKKLDGELRIEPASYRPAETVFLDTSDVKCAGGSTELNYGWYGEDEWSSKSATGRTCETDISDFVVNAFVSHSDDYSAQLFAHAEQTAEFPVHPGQTDPDYFRGGTLYYGADSDANTSDYAWTVVGNPTEGITAVKETSGDPLFADPTRDNAVELLRRNATPQNSSDTVLRGYMNAGVLLTDIEDAAISTRTLSADAYSADDQTVFQMSYADYLALDGYSAARFAAAENSSWGREYLLRNHNTSEYIAVDKLLNIQSVAPGTDAATREGINLNNKTVLFYSPADCELTFDALRSCRQMPQGEWKATVYDPDAFDDMTVQSVSVNFNSLSISAEFDTAMEGRQITAWGLKDGRIIWMDSSLCENAGDDFAIFAWEDEVCFDELYFVARKNNGTYRSDTCGVLYSALDTEITVEFYLDGEKFEYDNYSLKDAQNNEKTAFAGGEEAFFSTQSTGDYYIKKVEISFSDGTKITEDLDVQTYDIDFTVKGVRPKITVYIETRPLPVTFEVIIDPLYDGDYDFEVYDLTAPSSCLPGQSYDFTIALQSGFYITQIECISIEDVYDLPNDNPITVIDGGQTKTGYAPGTYTKQVSYGGDVIRIYIKELPVSLRLLSDPLGAGTVSAKLPVERSFSTLAAGDEVTVYAEPYFDYVFTGFTMKAQGGEETELPATGNSATFTMPNDNVILTAHFAKKNTVTVKLFMDGEPTDTGASWTLKGGEGTERSIFADGEQAYISATADTGFVISHIEVKYSDGTGVSKGTLSSSQDFDFTVHNTDPVVGIYLTTAQVPVAIEAQTVDAKGSVLDAQGGAVYAPSFVKYGDSFTYNASAFEGYYISAIYRNDVLVPNTEPVEITDTVVGYGAEEYRTTADSNSINILVTFTKIAEEHSITSEFFDISLGTPAAVTASATYTVNGRETETFCAGDEVTATVNCADNLALVSTETGLTTAMTQTGKYTFTFTMPDEDLAITYNFKKLAVRSAYLHVNEDINLIYSVQVPEGFTNPTATYTFMDKTYEVSDYEIGADGRYNFEFEKVTPQYMGEPVDVTVSANYGDYSFSHTNSGYSVSKYCVNMLGKTEDTILRTLLADILVYGEKAQLYTGYKTDALVTDGVDLSDASTYPGLSGLHEKFVGTKDADVFWNAALLRLSNNVDLVLKFHASDTNGLSVTVSIDNRTRTFTETDFTPVDGQEDFYSVSFRGIYATEFGYPVSASFRRNGAQVGNTLLYSVNIYICNKQNDGNEVFADLVKALYNYGASSLKYYQERMMNQ